MNLSHSPIFVLASFCALAACSGGHQDSKREEAGTTISVDASDKGGDVRIEADGKSGRVTLDTPAFDVNLELPKIELGSGNFDIDGVGLYPGSSISGVHVKADDKGGKQAAHVVVTFAAPAPPDKVGAWFAQQFEERGVAAKAQDGRLSGVTRDGDPFTISLTPRGNGSAGTLEVRG